MITYLRSGWYTRVGPKRLRDEVIDGAIDAAGMLYRAGVPSQAITRLALQVRTLATIADPPHRRRQHRFEDRERAALVRRFEPYTDRHPALCGFVIDCVEHVENAVQLRALYLHLVHISQMVQLLTAAALAGETIATDAKAVGASNTKSAKATSRTRAATRKTQSKAATRATGAGKEKPTQSKLVTKANSQKGTTRQKAVTKKVAKKRVAKKQVTKKQVAKKQVAKKQVTKKTVSKTTVRKSGSTKRVAAKKTTDKAGARKTAGAKKSRKITAGKPATKVSSRSAATQASGRTHKKPATAKTSVRRAKHPRATATRRLPN